MTTMRQVDMDALTAEVVAVAAFGGDVLELRASVKVQEYRCVGCGQVLELGAAVMTSIGFPQGSVPAAAHAECRDGLRVLGGWEALKETILLQSDGLGVRAASRAILLAYQASYGLDPPGKRPRAK